MIFFEISNKISHISMQEVTVIDHHIKEWRFRNNMSVTYTLGQQNFVACCLNASVIPAVVFALELCT